MILSPVSSPTSRSQALRELTAQFRNAGIDTASLDARFLLMEAAHLTATDLYAWPDALIEPSDLVRLSEMAQRRLNREPVARILGQWEFWGLPFKLSAATLVPRPETELIIEAAIAAHNRIMTTRATWPFRFVDIGTGTGCIAIAVASELPQAEGIAIDLSPDAARMAQYNALQNNVNERLSVINGSWITMLGNSTVDLILSNPPYIETLDIAGLATDVKDHDPHLALDGGADGLDPYRAIFADARRVLRPGGSVIVEFGQGQAPMVSAIAQKEGLLVAPPIFDLSGIERVIVATFV
ncbi:peptide chain release factor N(5)-glutamine methyltransferase [Pseudochelatococcus sp. G4_1912]|uniref:peptide chain release factor N(5)-glutamine methyltransferase n=1 Tax=Pseudochelatococcus sp. G4_1912 TaxID=3114288 RepID=UPI0039C6C9D7